METFTPKKLRILISILFVTMCSVAQVNVTEDFENGNFPFTLWQDGGDRCDFNTNSAVNGNNSVRLKRGGVNRSTTYTSDIDLTSYTSVSISFDFKFSGCENGDDFFVEYSEDSVVNYTNIGTYTLGGSYSNNTIYNVSIPITDAGTTQYTSTSRFRIRGSGNGNNDLFFF